ncbi:hypothetical protein [Dokdonella sp.]|uniref:hypothetical protein n=1 Tax=Dokdonella sp. TaxID=2291710 RepID=UPI00378387AB
MSMLADLRPPHPQPGERTLESDLCIHIFTTSAALVGVCLTVIGLIRVVIATTQVGTIADDLLAGDATLFMISCVLSYWALRARSARRMHRIERAADAIFLLGLLLMTIVCGVVTWALL